MTEAYVRIKVGDKRQSIQIDELTDEELDDFADQHPNAGWK